MLLNPAVLQDPVTIKVQSTEKVIISRIDMDPDKSDGGVKEPLRILKMQVFTTALIGSSSKYLHQIGWRRERAAAYPQDAGIYYYQLVQLVVLKY